MNKIEHILNQDISNWILAKVNETLTGHAFYCARNAWQYLERSRDYYKSDPKIALFCAINANEEAVACLIRSAKTKSYYKNLAKKINIRDHDHKAIALAFTKLIYNQISEIEFAFAHSKNTDELYARIQRDDLQEPENFKLSLSLISFNQDFNNHNPHVLSSEFDEMFIDELDLKESIKFRAKLRDQILYANKKGLTDVNYENQLKTMQEYTWFSLGLIWAAIDIAQSNNAQPLVSQFLGAIPKKVNLVKNLNCSN